MSYYTFTTTDADIQARTVELIKEYEHYRSDGTTINRLVKEGVDVDAWGADGLTLLHHAAQRGDTTTCAILIDRGADIHARGYHDFTPLHLAAQNCHFETCVLLIERGAHIDVYSVGGTTPLHGAVFTFTNDTKDCLLSLGANVWTVNDTKDLLKPHIKKWQPILAEVMAGKCEAIKTTEDLYHLASVMKPENPENVPPPKEFIRILFQQYLPHEPKFDAMYSEIFAQSRPPVQDLKATREAAKGRGVAL